MDSMRLWAWLTAVSTAADAWEILSAALFAVLVASVVAVSASPDTSALLILNDRRRSKFPMVGKPLKFTCFTMVAQLLYMLR